MVDMFRCPSYYDDDGVLRDCKCGKCEPSAALRQVGTIFGVPILIDLTNTVPEDRIMILDQSQMALQNTFNERVKHKSDDRLVKPCENCGKPITPRRADVNRGWGRFCSKRCKAIYQVKHG